MPQNVGQDNEEMFRNDPAAWKKRLQGFAEMVTNHQGLMSAAYHVEPKLYRPGEDEQAFGRADYYVMLQDFGNPCTVALANIVAPPGQPVLDQVEKDAKSTGVPARFELLGYCSNINGIIGLAAPSLNPLENLHYEIIDKKEANKRCKAYNAMSDKEQLRLYQEGREAILQRLQKEIAQTNARLPIGRDDNNILPAFK